MEPIKQFLKGFMKSLRHQSMEYIEFELRELENVFALVLMGAFVGIPPPPTTLVIRLMPHMVKEMHVMQQRAINMDDIFAEIAGMFDIDGGGSMREYLIPTGKFRTVFVIGKGEWTKPRRVQPCPWPSLRGATKRS